MQGIERYYAVHKWFEVKGNGRKFQTQYLGKSTLTGDYVYRYIAPRDSCGFAWSDILSDLKCNNDEVTPRIIQKDDLSKHFNLDVDYDAILEEAKRRYPIGTQYKPIDIHGNENYSVSYVLANNECIWYLRKDKSDDHDGIECGVGYVYLDGKWAALIDDASSEKQTIDQQVNTHSMKNENIRRIFKVKHTSGVLYRGSVFKYIGKSRIDGYPMYSVEMEAGEVFSWDYHLKFFIFNGKPNYTPTLDDFELVQDLQDYLAWERTNPLVSNELVEVGLVMAPPSGILYNMDYVYDEFDERLNLML